MQERRNFKRCLALVMGIVMFCQINVPVGAQEYTSELKKSVVEATKMIEEVLNNQYEGREEEIKEIILEKEYDYTMTMESFYGNEEPYRDANYLDLITTYAAIKEYLNEKGQGTGEGLSGVDFLKMEIEEKTMQEEEEVLVEKYEETEIKGVYKRNGNQVIDKEQTVGIYAPLDKESGTYTLVGEKTVSPKTKEIRYGEVTLMYAGEDELYSHFKVDKEEVREKVQEKKDVCTMEVKEESLEQSVFVRLPQEYKLTEEEEAVLKEAYSLCTDRQREIIDNAVSLIGQVPYEWGGKAAYAGYNTDWWLFDENGKQKGLDCSGFVQWVYMTSGYGTDITKDLITTGSMLGLDDISCEELEPGDIGLLNHGETTNHAGIYLGDGYYIHCSSAAHTVTISRFPFKIFKKVEKTSSEGLSKNQSSQYLYNEGVNNEEGDVSETDVLKNDVIESDSGEILEEKPEEGSDQKADDEEREDAEVVNEAYEETPSVTEEEGMQEESVSAEDIELLAKLIVHEAGNQGYNGKVAVGEVVRNRMRAYGQSVSEVIYAPGQFADSKEIASMMADEESMSIARMILEDKISVFGNAEVIFFRNPMVTSGIEADAQVNWGDHTWYASIGDHAFYLN